VTADPPAVRLFVALDLPPAARAALAAFRAAAADPAVWRPVDDGALHLTLAFLGWRAEGDVPAVTALVEASAGGVEAPPLVLGDALALPPRRPRVLAAEVHDEAAALAPLQAALSSRLAETGLYEPERRPFRPHVTVARLRRGARAPRAVPAGPEPVAFRGAAVTLYRSRLARSGASYEPLASVPLAG
jgi:2'-5' RNA ligase